MFDPKEDDMRWIRVKDQYMTGDEGVYLSMGAPLELTRTPWGSSLTAQWAT